MAQTAIVTGATGGLGGAVTRALLAHGWRVVATGRSEDDLEELAAEDGVTPVPADLMEVAEVAEVAAVAGPGLRALVNLVGGFAAGGRVHEAAVEGFENQLRLHLRPTYLMSAAAIPAMLDGGGGAIVCVSPRAALRPFPGAAGYVTAKAAVLGFVGALDAEYRGDGIRVNAVLPSTIDTPANRRAMPRADRSAWVAPEAIAEVIAFLCSDAAAATSGAHVPVYGRG
jgi:NAD(P)-dependent dehydrogenase (short-subunit alcohol dehydrogenase family)